jgi:DNA gyrase subunit A
MADEKETNQEIGLVKPRKIEQEMEESYLDYAMSVIISRALPDVRDGLKPVHRRILYAMYNLGLTHTAKYRKSATIVGETLGKYHPHGDVAVYDSMVRMAQDFAMRYPLISGQGNFGSQDGDAAAAMRYTEAKMASITSEMLTDIEKDTILFMDNYDGTQKEPQVLPARLPNLLLNGTMGIAVGMATNIPPHNLNEIVDGTLHLIDKPSATVEDLIEFIPGPDFPTGGSIYNLEEIKNAYATGKGGIVMRAKANIEEVKRGYQIVISELPYQVNKAMLVEKIAQLIQDKRIQGVSDLRDESDREGVRIVLDLKRDSYPKKVLNQLYKCTPMQSVFYVNMVALTDGLQPRVLTLKMILQYYISHRQQVVRKRCEFDLKKAKERAHILEGLKIALDNLSKVISIIKKSKTKEEAHKNLVKKFKLTEIQTTAILEMRLHQLAKLERKKIEDEYKEKLKLITELKNILLKPKRILKIIKEELLQLKEKYRDERRTKIHRKTVGEFASEDLIPNEEVIVTVTKGNYIKRLPLSAYKAQRRGGKGVIGISTKEEDIVEHLVDTFTHDNILFFTNKGRVFQLKVYDIPRGSRLSKGQAIVNLLQIGPDENITGVITLQDFKKGKYLVMATKCGMIKKTPMEDYSNVRKSGLIAVRLKGNDELKWVKPTFGSDEIILVTSGGQAIRFSEKDIRPMSRGTMGVRGIKLKGDCVVGMSIILKKRNLTVKKSTRGIKTDLLVISENGFGKKTSLKNYHLQRRGGVGIKTAKITERTGKLVDVWIIDKENCDLIMISKAGQVIRLPIDSISRYGRVTSGVRLMRLNAKDRVATVVCIEKEKTQREEAVTVLQEGRQVKAPPFAKTSKGKQKEEEKKEKKRVVTKKVQKVKPKKVKIKKVKKVKPKKAIKKKKLIKKKAKKVTKKKTKKTMIKKEKKKVKKSEGKKKPTKKIKKITKKPKTKKKKVKNIVKKPKVKKVPTKGWSASGGKKTKSKPKSKKPSKTSSKKRGKSKKRGRKKIFT